MQNDFGRLDDATLESLRVELGSEFESTLEDHQGSFKLKSNFATQRAYRNEIKKKSFQALSRNRTVGNIVNFWLIQNPDFINF